MYRTSQVRRGDVPMNRFDSTYDRVYFALEILIEAALKRQQEIISESLISTIPDMHMVRMSTARRCGHSTAILRYCQDHPGRYAVFGMNNDHANAMKNAAKRMGLCTSLEISNKHSKGIRFASVRSVEQFRGSAPFSGIFFDCAWSMSASLIKDAKRDFVLTQSTYGKPWFMALIQ